MTDKQPAQTLPESGVIAAQQSLPLDNHFYTSLAQVTEVSVLWSRTKLTHTLQSSTKPELTQRVPVQQLSPSSTAQPFHPAKLPLFCVPKHLLKRGSWVQLPSSSSQYPVLTREHGHRKQVHSNPWKGQRLYQQNTRFNRHSRMKTNDAECWAPVALVFEHPIRRMLLGADTTQCKSCSSSSSTTAHFNIQAFYMHQLVSSDKLHMYSALQKSCHTTKSENRLQEYHPIWTAASEFLKFLYIPPMKDLCFIQNILLVLL